MKLAQEACDEGNLRRAKELLEAHRPGTSDEDLRSFEWRYLWKLSQGEQIFTLPGHSAAVNALAISPNGKFLISASSDHTLKVWDVGRSELITTLTNPRCLPFRTRATSCS